MTNIYCWIPFLLGIDRLNIIYPAIPEKNEPAMIPIFAEFMKISLVLNAKPPINNDIVKPTPDNTATPIICLKYVFSGSSAIFNFILK